MTPSDTFRILPTYAFFETYPYRFVHVFGCIRGHSGRAGRHAEPERAHAARDRQRRPRRPRPAAAPGRHDARPRRPRLLDADAPPRRLHPRRARPPPGELRRPRPALRREPRLGHRAGRRTARSIVGSWLASPGHRANLLRPAWKRIGIGSRTGEFLGYAGATVVTADFAGNSDLGHQRAELGELLAPELVALAALEPVEQRPHERRQLDGVERLRDVVDAADVEPSRPVAELRPRGQEDDRDLRGLARSRGGPRPRPSRRGRASSRRAGSRPAFRMQRPRAPKARRSPRARTCPRPRD